MTSLALFHKTLGEVSPEEQGYLDVVMNLCNKYHGNQMRDDGSSYMSHVRDVIRQIIIRERKCSGVVDWVTVSAGGLHDIIEDSYSHEFPVTPEMIRLAYAEINPPFGQEVAFIVESVSKLPKKMFASKEDRFEEYRHRFFAKAEIDFRILLVKYPDRFHNVSRLSALDDPPKVLRVAKQTVDVFVRERFRALNILPVRYHEDFNLMVNQMTLFALAYLPNDYDIFYSPKPLTESGIILLP